MHRSPQGPDHTLIRSSGRNRPCSSRRLLRAALICTLAASLPAHSLTIIDTIGWTDRDLQFYGPARRYLVYDTLRGTHAVWKNGYGEIRYNYCPRNGSWRWQNGTVVNRTQRNLGCLDVDIRNGWAYISTDYLWRGRPVISCLTDSAAGAGSFREYNLDYDRRHNLVAASDRGYAKFAALSGESLYFYSYFGGFPLGQVGSFPTHNLAVSKQSGRFGYIWTVTSGEDKDRLFLKQTPNNGANWYATVCLSDSVPSSYNRSLLGACATYDTIRIHLIADFYDGTNRQEVVLWHYCPYLSPCWHVVHHIRLPDSSPIGTCNLAACRPSIGINRRRHELYVVWEQFDPENIDPQTGLCRAGIWASRSQNLGISWGAPIRLTPADSISYRFPFLAEVVADTLRILCFADPIAGVWEFGEGSQTRNPVLLLRVPADSLPVAIGDPARPDHGLSAEGSLADGGQRLRLLDALGRTLATGASLKEVSCRLPAGIYFAVSDKGNRTGTVRLVLVR
ncbi:MAG: hypothetical protein ABIK43_04180 [candidate division WOR-3 bacterium]